MDGMYDVVVVGGGAAGLSGALALARARRSVLVVDGGEPRNAPAEEMHNYLGRDDTAPGDLLATGRAEVAGYGGEVVRGDVVSATREDDGGFRATLADGRSVRARRLLVTTGLVDELPDVPGLRERWGHDVLHCPYCHGWEVRDRSIGVLSTGPGGVLKALLWRQWSADVTLFLHTGPEPSDDERAQLAARGIAVVTDEVAAVEADGDRLTGVRLASGRLVPRDALVVAPVFTARSGVLTSLGLAAEDVAAPDGHVVGSAVSAGPAGATAVPGVWVAGNVTDLMAQVITAAAAGLQAGGAINADLLFEDVRRAVAARQASAPPAGPELTLADPAQRN
ncbi:NAD(P)/FAD-dependent oxidoreductase [Modestobacter marinus]|uniref:NAD(P)/FAD-dependent oxidoreductase n=1 Tax=Modestobacter marinus TaxID=477641 RepID=UPI001C944589|nr:NAD(P)/FAD-dependent oxidoreductase [Modestobacter marinus]